MEFEQNIAKEIQTGSRVQKESIQVRDVFRTVFFNVESSSHNGGSHQCHNEERKKNLCMRESFHLLFRRKDVVKNYARFSVSDDGWNKLPEDRVGLLCYKCTYWNGKIVQSQSL